MLRALSLCACCRHYPGAAGAARVEHAPALEAISALPWIGASLPNWNTLTAGIAGFFRPNPLAFMGWHLPLAPTPPATTQRRRYKQRSMNSSIFR